LYLFSDYPNYTNYAIEWDIEEEFEEYQDFDDNKIYNDYEEF
jgi:hypothetical protein